MDGGGSPIADRRRWSRSLRRISISTCNSRRNRNRSSSRRSSSSSSIRSVSTWRSSWSRSPTTAAGPISCASSAPPAPRPGWGSRSCVRSSGTGWSRLEMIGGRGFVPGPTRRFRPSSPSPPPSPSLLDLCQVLWASGLCLLVGMWRLRSC